MKFGASVNFNAVEEWRDQYIDYEKLKRISLHIERLVRLYFKPGAHAPARPHTCLGYPARHP